MPQEEKKDKALVELHRLGSMIVDVDTEKSLITLLPTYLEDKYGWGTNKLGVAMYVRTRLADETLKMVENILFSHQEMFKGVKQVIVDKAAVADSTDGE